MLYVLSNGGKINLLTYYVYLIVSSALDRLDSNCIEPTSARTVSMERSREKFRYYCLIHKVQNTYLVVLDNYIYSTCMSSFIVSDNFSI